MYIQMYMWAAANPGSVVSKSVMIWALASFTHWEKLTTALHFLGFKSLVSEISQYSLPSTATIFSSLWILWFGNFGGRRTVLEMKIQSLGQDATVRQRLKTNVVEALELLAWSLGGWIYLYQINATQCKPCWLGWLGLQLKSICRNPADSKGHLPFLPWLH